MSTILQLKKEKEEEKKAVRQRKREETTQSTIGEILEHTCHQKRYKPQIIMWKRCSVPIVIREIKI